MGQYTGYVSAYVLMSQMCTAVPAETE